MTLTPRQPSRPVPPTQGLPEAARGDFPPLAADGDKLQREAPVRGLAAWIVIITLLVACLAMAVGMSLLVVIFEEITGGLDQ
jgi:hypothetical protein